ncbi:DNA topoisomerase [Pilobolus umbonatus]|nr:DNA topoisomerase [Pilobolus umbonatus]
MTSLRGHVLDYEFVGSSYKTWRIETTLDLFDIPITRPVKSDCTAIVNNLHNLSRQADVLFIWTDCDREGEAIGGDVVKLCQEVNPHIEVWRAHFSDMQPTAIHRAAQNHGTMDTLQIHAVHTRSELDFRIGAAFTRLQTLKLQRFFSDKGPVISFGSCQFPTLGFVVDRYLQIEKFVPEEFWKIALSYSQNNPSTKTPLITQFTWRRDHLFEKWACFILYEKCVQAKLAKVTKVKSKQASKWKPLPLTTVELQKVGCRMLRMSGTAVMAAAEELYRAGLISYPRTETDQYSDTFDFMPLIERQTFDSSWGQYAALLRDGEFERPRNGKNNDKAHPPIHPVAYNGSLTGNAARVYEFIARRFLGSCWKNAIGMETNVEVEMGGELFDAKGLVILERNYLEVYTYDKWSGNEIPDFQTGQEFIPHSLEMKSGMTTAPNLLTEADLIGLMESNEIGTDATIAEHIQKILDRNYTFKNGQYFTPSTLGISLVMGYDEIGFETSLSKPFLRREVDILLMMVFKEFTYRIPFLHFFLFF